MGYYSSFEPIKETTAQRGKRIRLERLTEARGKGTHTKQEWAEMVEASNHTCSKCGEEGWCKDHIIPISCGGSDSITNLQPLCRQCNGSKCADDSTDYRIGKPWMRAEWMPSNAGVING